MSKKIEVNSAKYLNNQEYTDYNEAYNALLSFIEQNKDDSDIIIYDKQNLQVKITLDNKNSYVNLPCLIIN